MVSIKEPLAWKAYHLFIYHKHRLNCTVCGHSNLSQKTTDNGQGNGAFYINCKCKFKGEGCPCSSSVNISQMVDGAIANGLSVKEQPPDHFKKYLHKPDNQSEGKYMYNIH